MKKISHQCAGKTPTSFEIYQALLKEIKMKQMKIYIASSWKNQHGVEMLTSMLRDKGHEVISWVENNYGETHNHVTKKFSFHEWMHSDESNQSFEFDTNGALSCDALIFYTYAGTDAHAEMALAWAKGTYIIGLMQKGYEPGLMSKMVSCWCERYTEVLDLIDQLSELKKTA